jgi:hypothetical protein
MSVKDLAKGDDYHYLKIILGNASRYNKDDITRMYRNVNNLLPLKRYFDNLKRDTMIEDLYGCLKEYKAKVIKLQSEENPKEHDELRLHLRYVEEYLMNYSKSQFDPKIEEEFEKYVNDVVSRTLPDKEGKEPAGEQVPATSDAQSVAGTDAGTVAHQQNEAGKKKGGDTKKKDPPVGGSDPVNDDPVVGDDLLYYTKYKKIVKINDKKTENFVHTEPKTSFKAMPDRFGNREYNTFVVRERTMPSFGFRVNNSY